MSKKNSIEVIDESEDSAENKFTIELPPTTSPKTAGGEFILFLVILK